MKHPSVALTATLALLAIAGMPAQDMGHDADVQAIRQNEAQWNRDYEAKDLDKLVAHYSDDAVLMAPGSPPAMGTDAIRASLKDMVGNSALSLKFEASKVEVAKSGDLAYTQGSYTMILTNPTTKKPFTDKGSYVTVYRKQGGGWKAVSDIATSGSMPMMAPTQ